MYDLHARYFSDNCCRMPLNGMLRVTTRVGRVAPALDMRLAVFV